MKACDVALYEVVRSVWYCAKYNNAQPACMHHVSLGLLQLRVSRYFKVEHVFQLCRSGHMHFAPQGGQIARMQNKLCDVTKCLTTVAAGVLSGRDRKKKLETGLLFEVLLLDQQISFGVRLFFVTRCPHVPLVTCQKA